MNVVLLILGSIAVVTLGLVWIGPMYASRHSYPIESPSPVPGVSTAGRQQAADESDLSPATIHEIETITGATDQHQLIGRRVNLDLKAGNQATQTAFWIGPRDSQILVVLARDVRTPSERQEGAVATSGITPVPPGREIRISGTVQAIPPAETRASWGLERTESALQGQSVYILADSVTPE